MQVLASPYQLPFAEKSVDACLLSHTLAYAANPHRILREVDRVLIDDGWLVISGFNPFSLLGLGNWCRYYVSDSHTSAGCLLKCVCWIG